MIISSKIPPKEVCSGAIWRNEENGKRYIIDAANKVWKSMEDYSRKEGDTRLDSIPVPVGTIYNYIPTLSTFKLTEEDWELIRSWR